MSKVEKKSKLSPPGNVLAGFMAWNGLAKDAAGTSQCSLPGFRGWRECLNTASPVQGASECLPCQSLKGMEHFL